MLVKINYIVYHINRNEKKPITYVIGLYLVKLS